MKPYPIVSKKGSMVTMNKGEREVTRDSSRFKPVSVDVPNDQTKEEDDEDPKVNLPPAFDEPKNLMKRKDEVNSINSYVAPQSQTEERIPIPQRKNPTEEPAEIKPQKVPYATIKKSASFNSPPVGRWERVRKTPTFLSDFCVEKKYTGNKKGTIIPSVNMDHVDPFLVLSLYSSLYTPLFLFVYPFISHL